MNSTYVNISGKLSAGLVQLYADVWQHAHNLGIEILVVGATDFAYLLESYSKIPEIFDALYEDGHMEAQDWEETKASAMKLGKDAATIAKNETKEFLENELFNQPARSEQFVRDMQNQERPELARNAEHFALFGSAFLGRDLQAHV